jgi:hypothetical protein
MIETAAAVMAKMAAEGTVMTVAEGMAKTMVDSTDL